MNDVAVPLDGGVPLVSCIMPTRGRKRYVAQSIEYFRRQDYPNRELIIVHNSDDDLPANIQDANIRPIRSGQSSIGGKRNDAVRAARGEIIVQWDDDDWYASQRLSRQVRPLLQGEADLTGLQDFLFLVRPTGEFWSASSSTFAKMFFANIAGGTLAYRKEMWRRHGPYPEISLREDAVFLEKALRHGARLVRVPGVDLFMCVRHDANTWKFHAGKFLDPLGWSRVPEPAYLAADRGFYFDKPAAPSSPLVSCIMPTADRRAHVARAIRCFLAQDYPDRELIVIDDGSDSVADLIPKLDTIRYTRLDERLSLGAKRNMAVELARGEIVAHWDDDDWMAPQWLSSQVRTLLESGADVCGLDKVLFYAPESGQAWRYVYGGPKPWVCGGTLCYTKDAWRRGGFPQIDVGEDNAFVWSAQPKRIAVNAANNYYVATVHRQNTSRKQTAGRYWHRIAAAQVEDLMAER